MHISNLVKISGGKKEKNLEKIFITNLYTNKTRSGYQKHFKSGY